MKVYFLSAVLIYFLSSLTGLCQKKGWKNYKLKDNTIRVSSRINDSLDEKNKKFNVVEYLVVTTTDVSLKACVNAMSDVSSHKKFFKNTELSETVDTIAENEWLMYYYIKPIWPVPKSDCVTIMKRTESVDEKTVTFEGKSAPDLYEDKGVKRMMLSDVRYIFIEMEDGSTSISMYSRFSPVINAPKILVNSWFPKGPTEIMERFIELAREAE